MEVRQVYYMGSIEDYPMDPLLERGVPNPPRIGWTRALVIPLEDNRSAIIDPFTTEYFNVSTDCEELVKSQPVGAAEEGSTIHRIIEMLVERDRLSMPVQADTLAVLRQAGVQLPEIKATVEITTPKEKTKRENKPSPREGLVSASDIAAELELSPKEVRACLRRGKEPKPDVGWAWDPSEVDRIKQVIRDHAK